MLMRIMGGRLARAEDANLVFVRTATFSTDMHFLGQVATGAAAAAFLAQGLAAESADRQFEALSRLPDAGQLSVGLSRRVLAVLFSARSNQTPIRKT